MHEAPDRPSELRPSDRRQDSGHEQQHDHRESHDPSDATHAIPQHPRLPQQAKDPYFGRRGQYRMDRTLWNHLDGPGFW
jgi:hypothetical protein